jgi:type I restriction enzyme S subunit
MGSDRRDVTIEEVATIKHGFAFKGEYFTDVPQPSVLLTPGNFAIGGGFQTGKPKYYCGPIPSDYVLAEGDLVVTMTDLSKASDTLGYAARVPGNTGAIYLHNQRTGLVQVKDSKVVRAEWLHYLMRTQPYRSWVIGSASGTTVKHTSPSRIGAYAFKLPPIAEQLSTAQTLDAIESRIDLLRQTNAALEAIAQALFKSWFVDFDPVHAKAEGREPEAMDAATAALFPSEFEESELGLVPKRWRVDEIGNVVKCLGGSTPSTKDDAYWVDGEHHWVTPKDLAGLQAPILIATSRRITDAGLSRISSGLLPRGTLLMSSRAPIGYLALAGIPTAINQGFIAMPPGGTLPPVYLFFWTHINMDSIKQAANGSTFMEISKSAFRPIKLCVPPPELVDAFAAIASPLMDRIEANEHHRASLMELRDVLLPRLISGKLRLPEAAEAAEAVLA